MVGDESALAFRPVLCGNVHAPVLLKQVDLQQVGSPAGTQQERRLTPKAAHLCPKIQQRGNANATTHEQYALGTAGRQGETIAQRQQAVEPVARTKRRQCARAVTDNCHKQPQFVALTVYEID